MTQEQGNQWSGIADALDTPFMVQCYVCQAEAEQHDEETPILRAQDVHYRGRGLYVCDNHQSSPYLR